MVDQSKDLVLRVFNSTELKASIRWLTCPTSQIYSLFSSETHGDKAMVFGSEPSLMKMRLGTTIKVLKRSLITLLDKTATGGCVMKTGRQITIEFTFARFSQAPGPSSQSPVNGRETRMVVPTPT